MFDNPPIAYGYVDTSQETHATMMQHLEQYQRNGLGASMDSLEAILGRPFPCARLRNLPFDATLEDILILFQGLIVNDIVLIGQGEAVVIFENQMDCQMALQRDGQTIRRSFVTIIPGSRSDYYSAIIATQQK
mmetsp:Transcript_55351/g.62800  ORF Transcript_55351/g.62800 Transcript_55351/m.62800 type:complete len:133 (+) Transcript_55351:187-585(+)